MRFRNLLRQSKRTHELPPDFAEEVRRIWNVVQPFTMTSPARVNALCEATFYIAKHEIPGSIVECGVWKGGSMLAVALSLIHMGVTSLDLFLFDTFEGMSAPTEQDVTYSGEAATELLASASPANPIWARASLNEVKEVMSNAGYPKDKIHFVKGKVEDTIPAEAPETVALLRLDTDWYESTLHELTHLYPRLAPGGVLVVDDYGHWQGARRAVDEYLERLQEPILLNRIDYTGRIAVKSSR